MITLLFPVRASASSCAYLSVCQQHWEQYGKIHLFAMMLHMISPRKYPTPLNHLSIPLFALHSQGTDLFHQQIVPRISTGSAHSEMVDVGLSFQSIADVNEGVPPRGKIPPRVFGGDCHECFSMLTNFFCGMLPSEKYIEMVFWQLLFRS